MALSEGQLPALKAYINSVPAWAALPNDSVSASFIAGELNKDTSFIVFKLSEQTDKIGRTISYVAIESLTALNLDKITMFYTMNPVIFEPYKTDVQAFWNNVLSGTLGGAGASSRAAMDALYRRSAKDIERVYATGTGTTAVPGTLVYEGTVTYAEVQTARSLPTARSV